MVKLDPNKNTLDKYGNLRIDYLFSYWIYVWFLIFYFTIDIKNSSASVFIQKHMNPTIALYFALFENIFTFIYVLVVNADINIVFKFLLMIIVVKILPIYLIRDKKICYENDIYILFLIFGIYNIYLWINDTNIYNVYERTFKAISLGENKTPFYIFLNYLSSRFY